jgi:hypothetical protein
MKNSVPHIDVTMENINFHNSSVWVRCQDLVAVKSTVEVWIVTVRRERAKSTANGMKSSVYLTLRLVDN